MNVLVRSVIKTEPLLLFSTSLKEVMAKHIFLCKNGKELAKTFRQKFCL